MIDLRKAAQEAAKVLANALSIDFNDKRDWYSYKHDVEYATNLLLQALAQPKQDDEAYGYAKYLAECIWEKHYKEESPHWRPFDNTLSVLTQIDNMTCGLEKAQPEQKPVAWLVSDAQGRYATIRDPAPYGEEVYKPLYTAPPKREWVGLTDEERVQAFVGAGLELAYLDYDVDMKISKVIESRLKEKNT